MASGTCWQANSLPIVDARRITEMHYLPYVGDPTKKSFYVKNVPSDWDEWRVFHVFRQFGLVGNIVLPEVKAPHAENAYRYGFVEMISLAGAENLLLKLNDSGSLFVEGLSSPLRIQRTTARAKAVPLTEVQLADVQAESAGDWKPESRTLTDEKTGFAAGLKKPLIYTKAQLFGILHNMMNVRPPKIAVKEILL